MFSVYQRLKKRSLRETGKQRNYNSRGFSSRALSLEPLEDRALLTVVFPQSHFGPETIAPGRTNAALQNPAVNLIFAGNWTNYQSEKSALIAGTQSILSGPYLSGLQQYGGNGAHFGTVWDDPNTGPTVLPAYPDDHGAELQPFLQYSISTYGTAPGIHDQQHAPIYLVILDPQSSAGDNGGFNDPGIYLALGIIPENINMIFVSTQSSGGTAASIDRATVTIAHELAERDVNNGTLFFEPAPYGTDPNTAAPNKLDQVADGEKYLYRLNGVQVQSYWSDLDQASIVPDIAYNLTQQKFILNPIWSSPDVVTGQFTNQYDIVVIGDQSAAGYADDVTLNATIDQRVQVTLNGESVQFDPSRIRTVDVNTGSGSNTSHVLGTVPGVVTNIHGGGADQVTVGNFGSLRYIEGGLSIDNAPAHNIIVIDDAADDTARSGITLGTNPAALHSLTTDWGYITGLRRRTLSTSTTIRVA